MTNKSALKPEPSNLYILFPLIASVHLSSRVNGNSQYEQQLPLSVPNYRTQLAVVKKIKYKKFAQKLVRLQRID